MNKKYIYPKRPNLKSLTDKCKDKYLSNEPYEHIYLKDVFSDEFLGDVYDEILKQKDEPGTWYKFCTKTPNFSNFGKSTVRITDYLVSDEWVNFIRGITGIRNLISDKGWKSSGVNFEPRGSHLQPHTDYNFKYVGWRRVNVLLFLSSKGWKEEWGGYAENGRNNNGVCELVNSYKPEYNSLVIFNASEKSIHGFDIVKCPEDKARIVITCYYYSNDPGPHNGKSTKTKYIEWDKDKGEDYNGRRGTGWKKINNKLDEKK